MIALEWTSLQLSERSCHLNSGWTTANHGHVESGAIIYATEIFEASHDFASNLESLFHALHPQRMIKDSWDSEVGSRRAKCDYQMIEMKDLRAINLDTLVLVIDGDGRAHSKFDSGLA